MGASLVVSVAFGLMQNQNSRVANRRAGRARKLQQRRDAISAARTRAEGIREARVKRGTAVARAANEGTGTSSGLAGQLGALSTASAGQQGYFNASEQLAAGANRALEGAASARADAATFGQLSNIFSQNGERIEGWMNNS